MKAVVLPRRGRQHPVHRFLIYLPAKARAAQDGKIAVSEDHERPGFHRSEEHTSELQSLMAQLVCRLLTENKKHINNKTQKSTRHNKKHTHLTPTLYHTTHIPSYTNTIIIHQSNKKHNM